jgi:hypothetical protein
MDVPDALNQFCEKIAGRHPILIRLRPEPWALDKHCLQNTDRMIVMYGGSSQTGWQFIYKRLGKARVLVGVHHCVWRSPEGELTDISPPQKNLLQLGEKVWFLPDARATLLTPKGCRAGIVRPSLFYPVSRGDSTEELLHRLRRLEKADLAARVTIARMTSPAFGTSSR